MTTSPRARPLVRGAAWGASALMFAAVLSAPSASAGPVTAGAAGVAGAPVVVAGGGDAAKGKVRLRLRKAVRKLPRKGIRQRGYDRDKFRHWVDANGDCEDARAEVLKSESKRRVRMSGCTVVSGRWKSYYDRKTVRRASSLDVDHMVPLSEAWKSGAWRWNAKTRERFANDLREKRSLVAVTASTNRSKGDRDPSQWLPEYGTCRYVKDWVTVKSRWKLSVNRAEKKTLRRLAGNCKNTRLTYRTAKVRKGGSKPPGDNPSGGELDPRFSTCGEAIARGYGPYYRGRDREYDWYRDADSDGVVCE